MNRNVIVGMVVGIILGFIAFKAFEGGILIFGMTILLGLVLGWLNNQRLRFNFYITAILLGILLYLPIAIKTHLYMDDTISGAVLGLIIALCIRLTED